MQSEPQAIPASRKLFWAGWIVGLLPVPMMLFSASMKFIQPPDAMKNLEPLGWDISLMLGLGIVELACTVIYVIPRTAVLGAILLTGYLGGAVATHIRIHDFANIGMPILLGVLFWGGLWLRDERVRKLIPLRLP